MRFNFARSWTRPTIWGAVGYLLVAGLQLLLLWRAYQAANPDFTVVNYGFAIEIGLVLGATEMISRYRDDPLAPLVSVPGAFYILINGGAAALAFYLMVVLKVPIKEPMRTLAAGLGAMAFFRSGIFMARFGNTDVAIGPNVILQTILSALDRTYDRQRAVPRSKAVAEIMSGLSFVQIVEALPTLCFDLMQNVSAAEIAAFQDQKRLLAAATAINDEQKVLSLGLALFNIVGEGTLRAAVGALGGNVRGYPRVKAQLLIDLSRLDPDRVVGSLPQVCAELPIPRRGDAQAPVLEPIPVEWGLAPESQALLVLYKLVDMFGEERVAVAVAILLAGPSAPAV